MYHPCKICGELVEKETDHHNVEPKKDVFDQIITTIKARMWLTKLDSEWNRALLMACDEIKRYQKGEGFFQMCEKESKASSR